MNSKWSLVGFLVVLIVCAGLGYFQWMQYQSVQNVTQRVDQMGQAFQTLQAQVQQNATKPVVAAPTGSAGLSEQNQADLKMVKDFMLWSDLTNNTALAMYRYDQYQTSVLPGYHIGFQVPFYAVHDQNTTSSVWNIALPPSMDNSAKLTVTVGSSDAATVKRLATCAAKDGQAGTAVKQDGLTYCKYVSGDCGAGSCGNTIEYQTVMADKLVDLNFFTYGQTCMAVDDPTGCSRSYEGIFANIFKTVRIEKL